MCQIDVLCPKQRGYRKLLDIIMIYLHLQPNILAFNPEMHFPVCLISITHRNLEETWEENLCT